MRKRPDDVAEEDFQPLVGNGSSSSSNKASSSSPPPPPSKLNTYWPYAVPIVLLSLYIFYRSVITIDPSEILKKPSKHCPQYCPLYLDKFGHLTDTSSMLSRALEQQDVLKQELKKKYGSYYPFIFEPNGGESIGKTGFGGGEQSRQRFIRKLMKKLLNVQLASQQQSKHANGCDCSKTGKLRRFLQEEDDDDDEKEEMMNFQDFTKLFERFVFVNGGHSSAAGHGNMFNETYTAVMETAAVETFASVGIEFEGRNYAMGGMASSPELALCAEAVYGLDADLLTWNFGMTDGNDVYKMNLYANRRGVHRNRPVLLDLDIGQQGQGGFDQRTRMLADMEQVGLAAMYMIVSYMYSDGKQTFWPDAMNMTEAEMEAVPEYLRYIKCGEEWENGEPFCHDVKYNEDCAPHKAPWHPGWKAMALNGNILAVYMVDMLIDALKELERHPMGQDKEALLAEFQRQEDEEYETFTQSNARIITEEEFGNHFQWNTSEIGIDHSILFRTPTVCHTALLPAKTRYRGILTETMHMKDPFVNGIERKVADASQNDTVREMDIVYTERNDCPYPVSIDYKDYWFVRKESGKRMLQTPNKLEQKIYSSQQKTSKGLIMLCLINCDWGKCADGDLREDAFVDGNATMWVNSVQVQELVQVADGCNLLHHEHGYVWKMNKKKMYELEVQVHTEGSFFRISSVITIPTK